MYNKNNSIRKIYLIAIAIISMVSFSYTTKAANVASMDTFIQKALSTLDTENTVSSLNNPMHLGNVYSNAYTYAQQVTSVTTIQTILTVQSEINNKYSCNLDMKDMETLLTSIGYIANTLSYADSSYIEKINNTSLKKPEELQSYVRVCSKLIACRNGTKNNPNVPTSTQLTSNDFIACNDTISSLYATAKRSAANIAELSNATIGNDIYYNGTIDDSPYDILYDIQKIGDILFTNNEVADSYIQYSFPNGSIAGLQFTPVGATSSNFTSQYSDIVLGGSSLLNNTTENNNTTNNTSSENTNPNQTNSANTTSQSSQNNNTSNSSQASSASSTPILPNGTNIINNYACLPAEAIGGTTGNDTLGDAGTTPDSEKGILFPGSIPSPFLAGTTNTNAGTFTVGNVGSAGVDTQYNTGSTDDGLGVDREDPSSYEKAEKEILTCMNKCEGMKPSDKAMCVAKCTCGGVQSKGGMFNLRICTVPSVYRDVVRKKPVQSIQEVVSEINNVLIALKNSGQLIKHTKTTEFLDTSLSKIKLNQIFAFDVNIAFKPVLNQKSRLADEAINETRIDLTLNGNYDSIDIGEEKNKYLLYWNPELTNAESRGGLTVDQRLNNVADVGAFASLKQLDSSIALQTAKTLNAEVANIVEAFITTNIQYRQGVSKILGNIQMSSDELRQKILHGK